MTFTPPPCKDCTGRYIGCHSGCSEWQEWKAEEDKRRALAEESRREEKMFDAMHAELGKKILRKQQRRR